MTLSLYGFSISDSESDTSWEDEPVDDSSEDDVSDFSSDSDLENLLLQVPSIHSNVGLHPQPLSSSQDKSSTVWILVLLAVIASLVGIYLAFVLRSHDTTTLGDSDHFESNEVIDQQRQDPSFGDIEEELETDTLDTSSKILVSYPTTLSSNLVLRAPVDIEFTELLWSCDIPNLLKEYSLTSTKHAILVLDPSILLLNDNVTFDLQFLHGNGTLSKLSTTIHLSQPLFPSNLIITPLEGTAASTSFHFSHSNSPPSVLYDWCIVRKHHCLSLGQPSLNSNLKTMLPPGFSEDKGKVTIIRRTLDPISKKVVNEESVSVRVEAGRSDDVSQMAMVSVLELMNSYDSVVPSVYALSETIRHHKIDFPIQSLKKMRNHLFNLLYHQSKHPLVLETLKSIVWTSTKPDAESLKQYLNFMKSLLPVENPSMALDLASDIDRVFPLIDVRDLELYNLASDVITTISKNIGFNYSGNYFDIQCASNVKNPSFTLAETALEAVFTSSNGSSLCVIVPKDKNLNVSSISNYVLNSDSLSGGPLMTMTFPSTPIKSIHRKLCHIWSPLKGSWSVFGVKTFYKTDSVVCTTTRLTGVRVIDLPVRGLFFTFFNGVFNVLDCFVFFYDVISPFIIILLALFNFFQDNECSCYKSVFVVTAVVSLFSSLVALTFGVSTGFTFFTISFLFGHSYYMSSSESDESLKRVLVSFIVLTFSNPNYRFWKFWGCFTVISIIINFYRSSRSRCLPCLMLHYFVKIPIALFLVLFNIFARPGLRSLIRTKWFVSHAEEWFFPIYRRL
ncbi:hypothetical protein GEMRC1_003754 [Eukaryota sp. GEM-RC1]